MIKILFKTCQETDPVAVSRGAAPLALVATPTTLVATPWSLATPALVVAAATITSTTIAAAALTLRTRNNHQSGTQTCWPQNYAFQHHCPDFTTTKSGRYAYFIYYNKSLKHYSSWYSFLEHLETFLFAGGGAQSVGSGMPCCSQETLNTNRFIF